MLKVLIAKEKFTILTGCEEIYSGFEISAMDLALNVDLLGMFNFIRGYAVDYRNGVISQEHAFDSFIAYISEMSTNPVGNYEIWQTNPKIQIVSTNQNFLEECLKCLKNDD